jgi:hypothetical protein
MEPKAAAVSKRYLRMQQALFRVSSRMTGPM